MTKHLKCILSVKSFHKRDNYSVISLSFWWKIFCAKLIFLSFVFAASYPPFFLDFFKFLWTIFLFLIRGMAKASSRMQQLEFALFFQCSFSHLSVHKFLVALPDKVSYDMLRTKMINYFVFWSLSKRFSSLPPCLILWPSINFLRSLFRTTHTIIRMERHPKKIPMEYHFAVRKWLCNRKCLWGTSHINLESKYYFHP